MPLRLTAALSLTLLAACSQQPTQTETAEDFAARVGGGQAPAPVPTAPRTTAAEGAVETPPPPPGSTEMALAPGAERCAASAASTFIGKPDTPAIRAAIAQAASGAAAVRFLPPGTSNQVAGQTGRLNVMIDTTGVIRDLRCG